MSRTDLSDQFLSSSMMLQLAVIIFFLFSCGFANSQTSFANKEQRAKYEETLEKIANEKPNVILIMADDMGWYDIDYFGNKQAYTPNLARLGRSGVTYTNFYVASPVCSPSRAGFMTGRHPSLLGINSTLRPTLRAKPENHVTYLPKDLVTLTSFFKSRDYRVGHFGKWHLGSGKEAPALKEYGIDKSYAYATKETPISFLQSIRSNKDHFRTIDDHNTRKTIEFLKESEGKPVFANLWLHTPHTPLDPSDKWLDHHESRKPFWPQNYSKGNLNLRYTPYQIYLAAISQMDENIGQLLDYLDQAKLTEDTIIIFTSDNGPQRISQPTESIYAAGSTGPFRGNKAGIYEGGIRVPFIISWPRYFAQSYVDRNSVFSALDLLPSLKSMFSAGVTNDIFSGEDMKATFFGLNQKRTKKIFHYYRRVPANQSRADISPVVAVREGNLKLLFNPDQTRIELYNTHLSQDPFELNNLAKENPELVKRLLKAGMAWYKKIDPPQEPYPFGRLVVKTPRSINPILPFDD